MIATTMLCLFIQDYRKYIIVVELDLSMLREKWLYPLYMMKHTFSLKGLLLLQMIESMGIGDLLMCLEIKKFQCSMIGPVILKTD